MTSTLTVWKFVTPHGVTSALDKVAKAFKGVHMQLIKSNLTAEQEAQLAADGAVLDEMQSHAKLLLDAHQLWQAPGAHGH